jgi:hypothetical protein
MGEQPQRRSTRVLLKVPIKVKGTGADGQPFEEETVTVMVDGHGAQVILKNPPSAGSRLTITNLRSRKSCAFQVVRRVSKSLVAEAEWAVESLEPGTSFWGIHFPATPPPPPPAEPAEPEVIEALLACQKCKSRELARLTMEQYRTLGRHPSIKRACAQCGASTNWSYSYVDSEEDFPIESPPSTRPQSSQGGIEQRKAKRLTITLPVRIRWADGREELTRTENLSKTGVCFISESKMKVGDVIQLTVGYTGPGNETEVSGRVIRRQELAGSNRVMYAVHLDEPS